MKGSTGHLHKQVPFFFAMITDVIDDILWEYRHIDIPDGISTPIEVVLIRYFSLKDKQLYKRTKMIAEKMAKKDGMLTEEELVDLSYESGEWENKDQKLFDSGDEHIEFLKTNLKDKKHPSSRKKIQVEINSTTEALNHVILKRNSIVVNSSEYYANTVALHRVMMSVVCNEDTTLLWGTEREFLKDKNLYGDFIDWISYEIMNEGALETKKIREVARGTEWRILWMCSKEDLSNLFNKSVGDLNINQKMLIYWSRIYDSVFDDPDRPDQEIINDDELLDDWLNDRNDGVTSRDNNTSGKDHHENMISLQGKYIDKCTCGVLKENRRSKGLGETVRHDAGCNWGKWHSFTPEEREREAKKIYGKNNIGVRKGINSNLEKVDASVNIDEKDLVDNRSRVLMGYNNKVTRVNR